MRRHGHCPHTIVPTISIKCTHALPLLLSIFFCMNKQYRPEPACCCCCCSSASLIWPAARSARVRRTRQASEHYTHNTYYSTEQFTRRERSQMHYAAYTKTYTHTSTRAEHIIFIYTYPEHCNYARGCAFECAVCARELLSSVRVLFALSAVAVVVVAAAAVAAKT